MRTKRIPIAPIPGNLTPFWTILFILMLQLRCSHLKSDKLPPPAGHHHSSKTSNYVLLEAEDESPPHRFADSDASLYKFMYGLYNVTIPENSIGKTYVKCVPQEIFMGLPIRGGGLDDVKYRIVGGDRDKLFKAEERIIGDFAFLTVRTRTSNVILNREKNEAYKLKIRATIHVAANGAGPLLNASGSVSTMETETFVHVQVLDRNDLSPLFYPTHYAKTIPEDMPVHTSILKVSAEDADLGINGEIYYSFLDENDYFTIHPTSGVIMLIRRLQYVQTSQFNLVVLANDRGAAINRNSHQASRANVTIHVQQVNLYAPEIYVKTLSSTSSTSMGKAAANTLVYGIVKVSDKDAGRHGEIKRLQIVDGDPDRNFLIKPTGGRDEYYIEISKFSKIENSPSSRYNLTLQAEDNGIPARSTYKAVPVEIRSANNNLPVFTKQLYEVAIAESSPPNMPIIRLKVTDPDFGKNALVFLEIVAGNEGGEFRINPDTGMLYTQKPLDAEYKAFYTLTVTAIDQANVGERKQSSAKVKINILDVNDNDPIFEATNQSVTINENELAGTFVAKVTAKDRDSGENSYISYSIANLERVPFEIDHFTGVIRTTTLIDYETMRREYTLRVRASDWGLPYRRQTETELRIRVRNINDNRPQFERINCLGKIVRDIPVGSDVFTLSAIDFDANDFITYRLTAGNEDGCFQLDSTSGIISIGCDLTDVGAARRTVNVSSTDGTHFSDEMSMQIELVTDNKRGHSVGGAGDESNELLFNGYSTFECRETGVARRLAEILATAERNNDKELHGTAEGSLVALTPSRYGENVHAPEFVNFPQQILLNESVQLGETVTWIHAHDKDLGYNGKLIYWISSGDSDSVFRIDPDSGELQVIGYLDRERQDEYILNITVSDMGQPKRYSSKLLPVTMLDNNDNRPVFQKSLVSLHIKEDVANGTNVYCLNATDADSGDNGAITYLMQTAFREFGINETTGCIYLTAALDRERQEEYEIRVTAKDRGVPALTSQALVNVIVDDVNDNAPMFGVQEFIFKIREDIPRGTVVASVEATDFDRGRNAAIFFVLKEDAIDRGLFKIDRDTGVIRTQGWLDYETRQVHNLIVSAIDCGTPALTSDMPVVIEVVDVNENRYPPEFDDFVYTGKIKENQPKGSIVMNVTARDLDLTGPEARISYSIRGGDGLGVFAVNDQGSIRTLSHLDAETKSHYWLTLCAQDNAIVPLSNCVKIYIAVENENDNVPLTDKPVYYVSVPEGSPANTEVIQLEAIDIDRDPTQRITYMITSGHPVGYFKINHNTGVITTTERKLDRENLQEHILEVSISDNGSPALSSTTKVVIAVDDINDCSPEFDQRSYKIEVPSTVAVNESIFQVQAFDDDKGENGRISYYIKSGKGRNKFRIDSHSGYIYLTKPLESKKEYELNIKAEDNGHPKRNQSATVNIVVNTIVIDSPHPPVIKTVNSTVDVIESDRPGFPVTLIQATDEDNDTLSYNISDGDYKNEFYIGRDSGNILLAKCLDWEAKSFYNLTVTVSDGTHVVSTQLYVHVININDNRPQFTKDVYYVNISENIEEESVIMQLHATDKDDDKIFYSLYAAQDPTSLSLFRIDSMTGNVLITQRLDYERNRYHVLIVMAKDQGTPSKPNYAKIVITVYDNNDHAPEFTSKIVQCKIPESAAIGSKVVQLYAIDQDNGRNAELKYSIVKGNVGNIFNIEPALGIVTLAKNLNINEMQEYMLQVKATDLGVPPLSSQVPVHVIITMSENDPPKFVAPTTTIEIIENQLVGTFVTQVETRSSSSVFYEIVAGNEDVNFHINPSTGVITTNRKIDYEKYKSFNLTVKGTNMASASSNHNVLVHMLDVNDNAPYFVESEYSGQISESAKIGSFVYLKEAAPVPGAQTDLLILKVADEDTGINAIVEYKITDDTASQYFGIDTPTGAIKLLQPLDYEAMTSFEFSIAVSDMGTPRLYGLTPAKVHIQVLNENDCPPLFSRKEYNTTLYTPTYNDFIVLQLNATDADADGSTQIRYDIVDGNTDGCFSINALNGIIVTRNIEHLGSYYVLHVRASDGLYSTIAQVYISVEPLSSSGGFAFQKPSYEFTVVENSTKVTVIGIVNVVGNFLHENVEYYIMNPTTMFEIGKTSGAIKTTGRVFDREADDSYVLIIEAKSSLYNNSVGGSRDLNVRRAHVLVNVSILDVNDNCPIFVNLPYYATVPVDETRGTVITRVKAVDLDSMENGEVRYELKKGNGELFRIDRRSGEISLKQTIESHNGNYNVLVAAYDNGITPCSTEVVVNIKVVDKSMPVFDKQFYSDTVSENVDTFSALTVQIRADSPLKRKLIYTIAEGNDRELFEIDYRNGVIYVVNELDYESQDRHELIVRATDSISGIFAAVTYAINVEDANDCYPIVEEDNYNVTLAENLLIGTQILKINASDCDTGVNSELSYFIQTIDGDERSNLFHIEMSTGNIYLKNSLDYEKRHLHHIVVMVRDHGIPALFSLSNVWITVTDVNDNAPKFVEPSFSARLSMHAVRGQFVTMAKAHDLDASDNPKLVYKIIDGNNLQTYAIRENSGVITLHNIQNFTDKPQFVLNVSVTDGVHTSYSRVKVLILPENDHAPTFVKEQYEAGLRENQAPEVAIVTVKAWDPDAGKYGHIKYDIFSDTAKQLFSIDETTGVITSKVTFDREQQQFYDIIVRATDGGGKFGFATVKVEIGDENDSQPYFNVAEYKAVVKVNQSLNTPFIQVKAIDNDYKANSEISYVIDESTLDASYREYISLDEQDGSISFTRSPEDLINKLVQFFVRASDKGEPPLHQSVPVSIQVIAYDAEIPQFEKAVYNLNTLESTPPGSILTKLRYSGTGNFTTKISIAADNKNFFVTETGELLLMQTLDREEQDVHNFIVCMETTTSPSLYAYAEVNVYVQDENDNTPKFDAALYSVEVPENMDKVQSPLIKITATDADIGPNGDIRYYMEDASQAATFDIDQYTGWISLLTPLDREVQSEYNFNVLASDNGPDTKHVSKVPVSVKVLDYNDNAAQFKETDYHEAIPEDSLPGTVLTYFSLSDLDLEKATIDYFIMSGDNLSQFQIGKTGELFLANGLDREEKATYNLSLYATDGKFVSRTNVFITVKDVNDNRPICRTPRYKLAINESVPLNAPIIKIDVVDYDENSYKNLRYYLTGNHSDDFLIEKETGVLRVAKSIDREQKPRYILNAHVQDGQDLQRECVSELFISVLDLNDNRPEFSMPHYLVSVSEDAPVQTVVTKVHATDKDFGLNRKISYSFADDDVALPAHSWPSGYFSIGESSGIVKLIRNLDRENISIFNITIRAEDHGQPKLTSTAYLIINVLDINDNPPEFIKKDYLAYVWENATVDAEVARVHATSKDIGVNAEISYYIIGGNEQRKFYIDSKTGVMYVNAELDYEKTKAYFLTVQAIDGGVPPLSNIASINITVLDVNDNKPKFSQNTYRIREREDVAIGAKILQITATDEDSQQNGIVEYNIERGDKLQQFSIDRSSGALYVAKPLDRETAAKYVLEIRACDTGTPESLCDYVHVNVDVLDVNDNPPLFEQANFTMMLQENKELGHVIVSFNVTDRDEPPNTAPYTFDFRRGNEEQYFRLEQNGTLRTAARFNHEVCDFYALQIRVFDNGSPPLYSDTWVHIRIIEESQYPPIVRPLDITVNSYDDDFNGGFLGQVYASDQDKYDTLSFALAATQGVEVSELATKNMFNISANGSLYAVSNLDIGLYKVNVTVTDGKFVAHTLIKVKVEMISAEMVRHAAVIRFGGQVSAEEFVLSNRKGFIRSISEIMHCRHKEVTIVAIQNEAGLMRADLPASVRPVEEPQHQLIPVDEHQVYRRSASDPAKKSLYVVIAVRKQQIVPNAEAYFTREELESSLAAQIDKIEFNTNLVVEDVVRLRCPPAQHDYCVHGKCASRLELDKSHLLTVYTDVVSFVTPRYRQIYECQCKQGYDGRSCANVVNACSSDPCPPHRLCWPANSELGYQCICAKGYSGQQCDIKISLTAAAACSPLDNGTCANESTAVSFTGKSYAHYKINKAVSKNSLENQFVCSVKIRTVQQTGTLLYASGRIDYSILEVLNGAVQYRFELGSGEGVVRVSSIYIADGNWHLITLERFLNTAKLTVDGKHVSQGSSPGNNGILNIHSQDLFIGAEVRPHSSILGFEDIQRGFIGCMTDIRLAQEPLPLYISGASSIAGLKRFTNVEFKCDPASVLVHLGVCGSQPCLNGGLCSDVGNGEYKCLCHTRFAGEKCEWDMDPCASSPCLFGGRCEYYGPGNYSCSCPQHLSGKRCEYGKFCSPNPCRNGGVCEEGDGVPHCMCRGFSGPTCENDVNECDNQPCGSGATCINEAGSFRCICPSYLTGASCGDPLYSNTISTKLKNFSMDHLTGIFAGGCVVLVFIALCVCAVMKRSHRATRRAAVTQRKRNSYKEANLNSALDNAKYSKKASKKLCNLEMSRPISYTPSSNENAATFQNNAIFVNNLDILRSYGSAGEELENIPFEYQKINITSQQNNVNSMCNYNEAEMAPNKENWTEQIHMKTFCEKKLYNDKKVDPRLRLNRYMSAKSPSERLIQVDMPNICHTESSDSEQPTLMHAGGGQYHWDCSDWVTKSQNPLPDITEVPGAEVADSSSFHSNDSNESKPRCSHAGQGIRKIDFPHGIGGPLNEELNSEYIESDLESDIKAIYLPQFRSNSLLRLSPIDIVKNDSYTMKSDDAYLRHPDSYLPPVHVPSETEGECSANESTTGRLKTDSIHSREAKDASEQMYLFKRGSNSDLSVHLCEIDDSELEEFIPKFENYEYSPKK